MTHVCLFIARDLSIPFPSKRIAEIVYDVLRVDPEPRRSLVEKVITLEEETLKMLVTVSFLLSNCPSKLIFTFVAKSRVNNQK